MRFLAKIQSIFMYFFYLKMKVLLLPQLSVKTLSEKNHFLELQSKNIQTRQNAGFFKLQYPINKLMCEVEILQLDIHRSSKFIWSFQVGVVRHVRVCPKLCQIVSQLHLKNEFSCKVVQFNNKICSIISSGFGQSWPK